MKRKRPLPSIERVMELLAYDPATGELRWKPKPAGSMNVNGYHQVCIDGQIIYAHRVAWLLTHGKWPENIIDRRKGRPL